MAPTTRSTAVKKPAVKPGAAKKGPIKKVVKGAVKKGPVKKGPIKKVKKVKKVKKGPVKAAPGVVEDDDYALKRARPVSAPEDPGSEPRKEDILAQVQQDFPINYADEDSDVRITVQVVGDYLWSRVRYFVKIQLVRDIAGRPVVEKVGLIDAYRIAKPTEAHPNSDTRDWCSELLQGNPTMKDEAKETAMTLQACFEEDGDPREDLPSEELRNQLADRRLLYICLIYVKDDFQGRGILNVALPGFLSLLRELPEWFAYNGNDNVILSPGRPDGDRGRLWGEDNEENGDYARETLTGIYQRHGFNSVGSMAVNAGRHQYTVAIMHRTVELPEEDEEEDDEEDEEEEE